MDPRPSDGELPPAWFAPTTGLTSLRELRFQRCALTGPIPSTIGALTALREIDLSMNALSGSVPGSISALQSTLASIDLSGNELSGALPASFFEGMTRLVTVNLSDNNLNGSIPALTMSWPMLQTLDLSDNYFEGVVPPLSDLADLTSINLSNNLLTGAIPTMSSLVFLEVIDLHGNAFSGALPDLNNLHSLTDVDVSQNALTSGLGTVGLGAVAGLVVVNLAHNAIEEDVPDPPCGPALETLDLRGNPVRGSLAASIGSCAQLRYVYVGGGTYPDAGAPPAFTLPDASAFDSLTNLRELSLVGLGLSGSTPSSLFTLPALRSLDLSRNALSGSVPAVAPGSLASLRTLTLNENALAGEVPASLLAAPSLETIRLSDNVIDGMEALAPGSSIDVSGVTGLYLAGNKLTSFPSVLQNATSLTALDLSRNALAGPIPGWIRDRDRLQVLRLGGNRAVRPVRRLALG